jgi:hypothetical protein
MWARLALGTATAWAVVGAALALGVFVIGLVAPDVRAWTLARWPVLKPLFWATYAEVVVLWLFWLVHAARSRRLHGQERVMWLVLLAFFWILAAPVYWYVKVWKEPR